MSRHAPRNPRKKERESMQGKTDQTKRTDQKKALLSVTQVGGLEQDQHSRRSMEQRKEGRICHPLDYTCMNSSLNRLRTFNLQTCRHTYIHTRAHTHTHARAHTHAQKQNYTWMHANAKRYMGTKRANGGRGRWKDVYDNEVRFLPPPPLAPLHDLSSLPMQARRIVQALPFPCRLDRSFKQATR